MTWLAALLSLSLVQASTLTGDQTRELIHAIGDALTKGYIYEDVAQRVAQVLEKKRVEAAFEQIKDAEELATQLTMVLQTETKDRHLVVTSGARVVPGTSSPNSPLSMVGRAEVLPDNIGYIGVRHFAGADGTEFDKAMELLKDVRALIIDLGHNPGGDAPAVTHLSTYLFSKPTHLVNRFSRGMTAPMERWTLESVPGPRLPNTPVCILTSKRTFSAAESFTFGLRVTGRAIIVGELTGGGGHFGTSRMLPHGFHMFVPVGRAYDPRTGKGWEAEGIRPDIEVPYPRALETAIEQIR